MLTPESIMLYGKYQGYKMSDIPKEYLLHVYFEKQCHWSVRQYVETNFKSEIEKKL